MRNSANLGNRLGTRRSVRPLANARGPYRLGVLRRSLVSLQLRAVRPLRFAVLLREPSGHYRLLRNPASLSQRPTLPVSALATVLLAL
jgi:hypothetical protein